MRLFADKNRNRFFISHLATSVLVIGLFLAIVFGLWYPSPLAVATGVVPILLMMVAIDVFVGPIFGFLVYKTGKKTLKMDLAIIIIIQILAFGYGAYSVFKSRPVWIVYHGGAFTLVRNVDVKPVSVNSEYAHPSLMGPKFVGFDRPVSIAQLINKDLPTTQGTEGDIYDPRAYTTLEAAKPSGLPLSALEMFNSPEAVAAIQAQYPTATMWVGMTTGGTDITVLLDEQGQVLGMVGLRPWN